MRRNLLTSTALTTSTTLLTGVAWAADMAVKAPPAPVAAPSSWNGCYTGLNAGSAWVNLPQQVTVPGITVVDSSGTTGAFLGGGQIGCNWQRDPTWVLGLEGDIAYVSAKRTNNFAFIHGSEDVVGQQSANLRWFSTVRARLGYVWGSSLLYGTAGLAIGEIQSCVSATDLTPTPPEQFSGCDPTWRAGWTLGAGIEHALTDKVSAKLEYLYFDLGHVGYNVVPLTGKSSLPKVWNGSAGTTGNIIRLGVNIKFN
jgi:outer membrane immunogenic protein